jgi:hypothetical protein
MCALPRQHPVLVADSVWSLLHHVRVAAGDGDALAALGFPTLPDTTPAGEYLIDPDASSLTLACGTLGPAVLERTGDGGNWRWRPNATISFRERLERCGTENGASMRVRIRLPLPSIPGSPVAKQVITPPMADQMETLLGTSRISSMIDGLVPSGEAYSQDDYFTYSWLNSAGSTQSATAFIKVVYFQWALDVDMNLDITAGEPAGGGFRLGLTLPQLRAALQAAWQTAAEVVPAVILGDPLASITARPWVELSLSAPSTPEEILHLHPRNGAREARRVRPRMVTQRTVTISGPVIGLSDAEREQYIWDALARLAPGFGYRTS